jgi:TolB-like protein/class 3 adenylate cyclase
MAETRKLAAILAADVVGFSRLAGADEDRTLARLRALRSDLIDPTIAVHHGRVVKRTGDGALVEFRSVVDAVRCAIEVQNGMVERNAGLPPERRIEFRIGIHLGDVVEESDGDLMGDGVNIAARLEGIAKPGAICLSEDAYRQVKSRLDLAVSDLGPTQLKNIAESVRVYSLQVGQPAQAKPAAPEKPSSASTPPPRLSIVVLPFANLGGDPEQEYFVDGVTESLTTDLSRISGSFVIARNTAFTYKGKHVDVKQIGRELSVRYVLEGSVQRGGNRMRVNVQLIDAETGNHLWAERFDKPVADLFDLQDEIVSRLANQLNTELVAAEALRAEHAPTPDAMDVTFRAWALHNRGNATMTQARTLFHDALTLDPANVEALAGLALTSSRMVLWQTARNPDELLAEGENAVARALALAPRHAVSLFALGEICTLSKRRAEAISAFEQAIAANPNLAGAHAYMGLAKAASGLQLEDVEGHITHAFRLSPRDTSASFWCNVAGGANSFLSRYEEAESWFRRALEFDRNYANAYFYLAAILVEQGRIAEAQKLVKDGLAMNPAFSAARAHANLVALWDNPALLARLDRFHDDMRKAGAP